MAIRKCPYCKAIIEEGSEYCANCGTQLLFSEDEFIEEEIPGEKILDDEDEKPETSSLEEPKPKKRNPSPKKSGGRRKRKKKEEIATEEISEEAEAEFTEDQDEKPMTEELTSEEESLAEEEAKEAEALSTTPPVGTKEDEETAELPAVEQKVEEEEETEEKVEEGEEIEYVEEEVNKPTEDDIATDEEEIELVTKEEEELEDKEESLPKTGELDFKTDDLDAVFGSEKKEKDDIERFLQSIKEERFQKDQPPEEEVSHTEATQKEKIPETGAELPPWAKKLKKSASSDIPESQDTQDEEKREEYLASETDFQEKDITPPENEQSAPESGVGLPEELDQAALPFEDKVSEASFEEEKPKSERKHPSKFLIRLRSKIFDMAFIGVFWFVSLWLASLSMEVSLFKLVSASAITALIFYLILLMMYFSLFLFFIGETLGDRIFPYDE